MERKMPSLKDVESRIAMRRMLQSIRLIPTVIASRNRVVNCQLLLGLSLVLGTGGSAWAQLFTQNLQHPSAVQPATNSAIFGADLPTVDASYFGTKKTSDVKPATYLGDLGYQALQAAECQPGAYSCTRCDFQWYFNAEALWLRREGDRRFTLTQNQFMNNQDFEFGGRFTAGRMLDCVNAIEFVYTGPYEWQRGSVLQSPGSVNSLFLAFPEDLLLTFNDADQHTQQWRAKAQSFEVNYRHWVWDSVSTFIGARYLKYEEDYSLISLRALPPPNPTSGSYLSELDNDLIGAQLGGDIFFPMSLRTSLSLRGKGGVYGNFATREVRLEEDGNTVIFNGVDKVVAAAMVELGAFGNFQITPSIRLNAGYEVWWLTGVATTQRQNNNILTFASGTRVNVKDDIFLHGFSGGVQVLY
jgi:hypothetical protein